MTEIILVAQLLVAAGAALMALKYLAGPVPADYHRQIIEKSGGLTCWRTAKKNRPECRQTGHFRL